ncbi:AbrB/MazE/SpoVT family DNA-binding domain-containing protein [Furfurilactobacillus siliginis]|uniref:Transcriptional regulator n=1 Tax=Furfurilactobacillus siliginis TaxID=348151 RepID=A0A0R2L2M4_9LACO|nr:AbrB/MazE/SpoVT family DNA-binding domain-containing protein [Furfurilactobacillus siliginis]KRN96031.1 transcriptional regulator [Furfurilactobacillus siliginis]GEK29279.1 transcriptional regulator [Furfurilactobacillus siliginis]
MTPDANKHITLPPEVAKRLNVHKGDRVQLTLSTKADDAVIITPNKAVREEQTLPIRWFLIPSLITSILFFWNFFNKHQTQIPLSGDNSIASFVIILGIISGVLSFITFYLKQRHEIQQWLPGSLYWRSFPTILLSFIIILSICVLGFFWFAGLLFKGITFDQFTSTFLFFIFVSLINYLMILAVSALSADMIYSLLVSVIVGGALSSMITNSNKRWWEHNLSFLGTAKAANGWTFNVTLMVSALLTVALVDFIFSSLEKKFGHSWRLLVLRILLTLTALCLGGVGLFANNGRGWMHLLHDLSARWMVYLLIIIILAIHYLLPHLTREFLLLSYSIGGLLVVTSILFQPIGYLSLTAYEMIGFTIAFSWMVLLLQTLQRRLFETNNVFHVDVE